MNNSEIPSKPTIFKPEMAPRRPILMEDLRAAQLAFHEALVNRGVRFASIDDENRFWDSMTLFLEESFDWPHYGHHN